MILETDIEQYIRKTLEAKGFKVIKLVTPGTANVMDRMILRPRYWPGPPMFLEIKRGGKELRAAQAAIAKDWTRRGCHVMPAVRGMEDAKMFCSALIAKSYDAYKAAKPDQIYDDPIPAK